MPSRATPNARRDAAVAADAPADDFASRVVAWQREAGRNDLPWQGSRDPYRVWLSEIMLQQTQVATVRSYFVRFLERFPDVGVLAAAPLDDVLALWSGLGYYARARNLHRCAGVVVERFGGAFPRTSEALAGLPGIGPSTAAAIAAFCYGERAAILDGNVKRVLTRALGFDGDLSQAVQERALWARARSLLPPHGIERYTQGLMDLGASVCLARSPRCDACPLSADCVARATGRPQDFPVKTRRSRRSRRTSGLLWLRRGDGAVWLVQRPARGIWAGLWSLPEAESVEAWRVRSSGWPGRGEAAQAVEHVLTHLDWRLEPWRWTLPADADALSVAAVERALPDGRWVGRDAWAALGLAAPVRRLLEAAEPSVDDAGRVLPPDAAGRRSPRPPERRSAVDDALTAQVLVDQLQPGRR